jgi:hypothetical protein
MSDEYVNVPIIAGGNQSGAVPQLTQFSDRGDLIEKIKPELMVEIIRQRFLGKEFINGKWVSVDSLKDRKLSEIGAWELANLMLGVSSINISISKMDDREIKERAYRIAKTAQRMLLSNWKEYGIKNASQFHYVHEILFSNTIAVLKQSGEGSIQELLKGTIKGQIGDPYYSPQKESAGRKIGRMLGLVGN